MFLSQTLRVTFVTLKGPIKDTVIIAQNMMVKYLDGMILGMHSRTTKMQQKMYAINAQYRFVVMPYSEILWMTAMVAVAMGKMQV